MCTVPRVETYTGFIFRSNRQFAVQTGKKLISQGIRTSDHIKRVQKLRAAGLETIEKNYKV